MLRLGSKRFSFELPISSEAAEDLHLKMIQLLEEHGWEFNYGRDPVLILIEYEEYTTPINEDEI